MEGTKIKCTGTKEKIDEILSFLNKKFTTAKTSNWLDNKDGSITVFVIVLPKESSSDD